MVLFAPRRLGKSSLVWRASQKLVRQRALVAQVDLMTTPTLARFAEKLAQSIHEEIASPLFRAKERLRVFQGLRVNPTVTVDPNDASLSFGFSGGATTPDMTATIERLLELPGQLAGERGRHVVLVLDEFQEVVDISPMLPRLMRAVFQRQPEVAHIYLGSRRHALEQIFSDENEPFWRSAKRMELGLIAPERFAPFIEARFKSTGRAIRDEAVERVLELTRGHPYATQELCYFLWQRPREGRAAGREDVDDALLDVLRSEDSHFVSIWDGATGHQRALLRALADEPGRPFANEYRARHGLPAPASIQRALGALTRDELVTRGERVTYISEPFLAEWIRLKI